MTTLSILKELLILVICENPWNSEPNNDIDKPMFVNDSIVYLAMGLKKIDCYCQFGVKTQHFGNIEFNGIKSRHIKINIRIILIGQLVKNPFFF